MRGEYIDAEAEYLAVSIAFGVTENDTIDLRRALTPEHFAVPSHRAWWQAITNAIDEGGGRNVALTLKWLADHGFGDLEKQASPIGPVGDAFLHYGLFRNHKETAGCIVRLDEALTRRRLKEASTELDHRLATAENIDDIRDWLRHVAEDAAPVHIGESPNASPFTLAHFDDADAHPVIDGLFNRDTRCVIVGSEGSGKSWLLRQTCLVAAQGLHPFMDGDVDPIRTLLVDGENPRVGLKRTLQRIEPLLTRRSGYDPERCRILHRPGGLDIRSAAGRAELIGEIRHHSPDLVAMGPAYKLARKLAREDDETAALATFEILDDLRTRYDFALMIEAHAPHGDSADRTMRPFGSSAWLRWPELGIGLRPKGPDDDPCSIMQLDRFRYDRYRTDWPTHLRRVRGGLRPWVAYDPGAGQ